MTETTLTLSRFIKASPKSVWRCWTEPDLMKQWFAPKPVVTSHVEIDLRPGGRFKTVMQVPDHGEMSGDAGCFLLVEPETRLVWTNVLGPDFGVNHIPDGPMSFGFSVDLRFTAKDGGCQYDVLVQHATTEATKAHADMGFHTGWGTAADQMQALAATL